MKKRSAYTTDQEVEALMTHQGSWDIVDPQPAEKKSKRHQEGPFEVEDSLPGHLKELLRDLIENRSRLFEKEHAFEIPQSRLGGT
jgi:hypothetical protein